MGHSSGRRRSPQSRVPECRCAFVDTFAHACIHNMYTCGCVDIQMHELNMIRILLVIFDSLLIFISRHYHDKFFNIMNIDNRQCLSRCAIFVIRDKNIIFSYYLMFTLCLRLRHRIIINLVCI